jgi:hypothetical protein
VLRAASACSGVVIRPTRNSGLELTCLTAWASGCYHPGLEVHRVWMKAWCTPAKTLT